MTIRLTGTYSISVGEQFSMVCSLRLMKPDKFLNALRDFPDDIGGASAEAVAAIWNRKITSFVDAIAPRCCLPRVSP